MDLLYWSRHFRNMPGEGELPVTEFMRAVAATGYDGYVSLEIFNDQFRGGSPTSISVDGHRSLVYLMDQVRRTEPDITIPVPAMPPRADVLAVSFIEFAASLEDLPQLESLLSSLGFHLAGRHRTKSVALYRQGDINLVINTEERGFAGASYVVHGANAYAIGLKVTDARAARDRAVALGAKAFDQPVDLDGISMPAIRGLGGSVIYFLDDGPELACIWEREFALLPEAAEAGAAGLARIDHIAQTVPFEQLLTWILFYTSILEAEKTPMVDIIDPAGVVHSQVVENNSGTLRITLNGAENRKTLAGHFIAGSFGSGTQHLAFETHDIFKTADLLQARGFTALSISPNYYGDVEARFGLDPELTEALKRRNILYDRDEHGEYFQLYSPTYGEGFFVEIVERRSGYSGYGAANAIFRIAALRKHLRPAGMPRS